MSLKKTILLGSGGHASVLFEVFYLLNEKLAGIVDKRADVSFRDCPYLGDDTYLESIKSSDFSLVNGIGRNGHPNRRADIFEDFKRKDFHFLSVIHPSVIQANDVCLGEGVQLLAGVIIQPKVHIEKNVIVNTGALIEHDTQIAEHVFIGPK
ncbi:MAG TPA: acetyltransferase, partial [Legionellales bacterium]|nr:acetyltransferase [Legionellales bacterium]